MSELDLSRVSDRLDTVFKAVRLCAQCWFNIIPRDFSELPEYPDRLLFSKSKI